MMASTITTTDFDYIGTGGLLIQCTGGKVIGLSKQQVSVLISRSPFFRGCLEIGMQESSNRIILKQDWSIEVVRHLVEACMTGYTLVETPEKYSEVADAADQALMDLFLCDMVCYDLPSPLPQRDNRFLELVNTPMKFHFSGVICPELWYALLEKGLLLLPKHYSILLKMPGVDALYRDHEYPEESIFEGHDPRVSVPVHTDMDPVAAILCMRNVVNEMDHVEVEESGAETFYLTRIQNRCWGIKPLEDMDPAELSSFQKWSSSSPFSASSSVLAKILETARPRHNSGQKSTKCCRYCSRITLIVTHPNRQTLQKLLHATGDQKRVLLMDPHKNVYGCQGSVPTLIQVLEALHSKEVTTTKRKLHVELQRSILNSINRGPFQLARWDLSSQSKDRLRRLQTKGKKHGIRMSLEFS